MVLDTVPEFSDSRPRLSDDLAHDTDVDSGSPGPTDITVGNELAEPGFYLRVRLLRMRLCRERNTRTSFTVAGSRLPLNFNA